MAGKKARAKQRKALLPAKAEIKLASPASPAFPKQFESFELKVTPNKGIGAFATRAMEAGTAFFKETPIMTFNKHWNFISEFDVARAYNNLSAADKTLFDEARHDPLHGPHCKCKTGTAGANSFGDPIHIYPIGSRFNHSCEPNTVMVTALKGVYHTMRTLKAVAPGDELSFSYSDKLKYLTTAQRRLELSAEKFGFRCLCSLCERPASETLVSDMRRVLLRYLHFWLRKKDVGEAEPCPALLRAVPDPKLKKRGVYTLLYAILHEAEGITSGGDSYLAYAYTVLHVLNVAYHEQIVDISPRVVQDIRKWMRKSEDNVLLQYGDLSEAQFDWHHIRKAASPLWIPDNGELDWENLMGMTLDLPKQGIRFFSSVPP